MTLQTSTGTPRIAVCGSINYDTVYQLPHPLEAHTKVRATARDFVLGGSAANTASAIRRLGIEADLIGFVGDDLYGSRCLKRLQSNGVNVSGVAVDRQTSTGHATVLLSGNDKRIVTFGSDSAVWNQPATSVQMDGVYAAQFVHFACPETPWSKSLADATHLRQIPISVEINGRHLPHLAQLATYVFLNSSELNSLTGLRPETVPDFDTLRGELGSSPTCSIIVTDEDRHVWVYAAGESARKFPIKPVRPVVNRNGAGDYFNGGFLWATVRNYDLETRVRSGLGAARNRLAGTW